MYNKHGEVYIDEGIMCAFLMVIFTIPPIIFLGHEILNGDMFSILLLVLWSIVIIAFWPMMKLRIILAFRVSDYNKNKNGILHSKERMTGKIIEIKSAGFYGNGGRYSTRVGWEAYYLIVDVNGEKVESILFADNIYNVGEEINVAVYNNRKYVLLYEPDDFDET